MHKYLYTYKITLLKGEYSGCYYYGQHSTNNLNDRYKGSGTNITKYFKKYEPIEGVTYVKEILHFYNDLDELNEAEAELIGDLYKTDPKCLNKRAGGMKPGFSESSRELCREHHRGGSKGKHWTLSEESKKNIGDGLKNKKQSPEHIEKRMKSKIESGNSKHSDETKELISKNKTGYHRVYNEDGTWKMEKKNI